MTANLNPQKSPLEQKTSFYYPLLLLPADQRAGMESLYRFCWAADDIADNSDPLPLKKKKLAVFKKNLNAALKGKASDPFFKQFQETIEKFRLSPEPLQRIVAGVERDLKPIRFVRFEELRRYALQVAGGPGLASMEIFGYRDEAHCKYAENLGIFLQIVNMVRDYREDLSLGRHYFPQEDYKRFHLNPHTLDEKHTHWRSFVTFQLDRAWTFLDRAWISLSKHERSELRTAEAIAAIYVRLHQKLRSQPDQVLQGRVSLNKVEKGLSALGAWSRCQLWHWVKH
jgi:phytoene synthase